MHLLNFVQDKCIPIQCAKLEDEIGEFANLNLFELENIRCTASQHRIVQFLIEFRKQNDGLIGIKNEAVIEKIKEFYNNSLNFNSQTPEGVVL